MITKTISLLAINAFVYSVIPYSKVKQVLFESWFRTLQKEKKLGEKLAANFISSRNGPVKSTETIGRECYGTVAASSWAPNAMH